MEQSVGSNGVTSSFSAITNLQKKENTENKNPTPTSYIVMGASDFELNASLFIITTSLGVANSSVSLPSPRWVEAHGCHILSQISLLAGNNLPTSLVTYGRPL
jgi:hypothetical protein